MKYDYIVLGAGSAGSIMASRLSEDPSVSVLLIEAGPDYPDFERLPDEVKFGFATATDVITKDHNWEFIGKSTDIAPPMRVPRGKVTGGSSAINGQMFLRGVPEDYDAWAAMGNDQWNFQNVLPFLRMIETDTEFGGDDFHNSDGPIIARRFSREGLMPEQRGFYDAALAAGFPDSPDQNHPEASGVGPSPLNNPNGIRWSTALGYLDPARHRLNLTIRPNALVRRILFEGKRATGVEVESSGERFVVEGNEVILSAGPVCSPHILMLSGVGPADQIQAQGIPVVHELPGVGQNLRDHPFVPVTFRTKPGHMFNEHDPRLQMMMSWTAEGSHLRNDMIFVVLSYATEDWVRDTAAENVEPVGFRIASGLYLAVGSGEIRLQSADPDEQPLLDYNYFAEEFDIRRMREGVRLIVRLSEEPALAEYIQERMSPSDSELAEDEALDAFIRRNATTGHHISGTCKMGPASDSMAVVDQHGRVHGMEGLRVVDASVMPDCIRANTNVTTMMIGEKIADFVRSGG